MGIAEGDTFANASAAGNEYNDVAKEFTKHEFRISKYETNSNDQMTKTNKARHGFACDLAVLMMVHAFWFCLCHY